MMMVIQWWRKKKNKKKIETEIRHLWPYFQILEPCVYFWVRSTGRNKSNFQFF
jgi:hypothetical protein